MHIFWPYLPLLFPPTPPRLPSSLYPSPNSFSFTLFLKQAIKFNVCHSYTPRCMATWSMVDLPRASRLKKTDSPSPTNHRLCMAPQLGMGLTNPFPFLCLDLVQGSKTALRWRAQHPEDAVLSWSSLSSASLPRWP